MADSLPPLRALRTLHVAAETGSFAAAAERLNLTPSAISHQIRNLEDHLGAPLFERTGNRVVLTERGRIYAHQVADAFQTIRKATRDYRTGVERTTLTIATAPSISGKWLMPRIRKFVERNPNLHLHVNTALSLDIATRIDADVYICYGRPDNRTLVAEPLIYERVVPLCSPSLLVGTPGLATPEHLAEQLVIHVRNHLQWSSWLAIHGLDGLAFRRELWIDRSTAAIDAAVNRAGVILESNFLAQEEIRAGRLIAPFQGILEDDARAAYYLAWPKRQESDPYIRNFCEWAKTEIAADFPDHAQSHPLDQTSMDASK